MKKKQQKSSVFKKLRKVGQQVRQTVSDKVESVKECFKAQAFYLKNFNMLTPVFNTIKVGVLSFLFCISVIVLSLFAEHAHEVFLEAKVAPNVFYVESLPDAPIQARGTAFAMKAKSGKVYTVTNAHICGLRNKDNQIGVMEHRTERIIPLRVIEVYPENDLCIVEGVTGYEGLDIGVESSVSQTVWTFGHALGEELNIAHGRVKAFKPIEMIDETVTDMTKCVGSRRHVETEYTLFFGPMTVCVKVYDTVATDVATFPGNSGSPMVDRFGKVVGVIFAGSTRSNWGFAVPLKDLRKLLEAY